MAKKKKSTFQKVVNTVVWLMIIFLVLGVLLPVASSLYNN
ncbi:DUF4044 domain-containing protein [Nicoliella spurrieriana]|uniref:DUF4044 domain-containing protein n=1 Tax=Nicoliella spurrieriana TaxID=2925830 RepID=A0A976X559_9LACO|nr:DUF4044 domain-containing protein [Nicoliella spurrieriana]UQS86429.1 DUF4044 domain-containing protein [Nicoliella spurrieriana]